MARKVSHIGLCRDPHIILKKIFYDTFAL